jgi:hypothetical protein
MSPGAETQAFLRLLRWAEANGRIERIDSEHGSLRRPDRWTLMPNRPAAGDQEEHH